MSIPSNCGTVYLVGAGPGSPGLLTVRAAELLGLADVVLYDYLVPERILDVANPAAECVCVRDLPGKHPDKYPQIYDLMIDRARKGLSVVRLKGGDPLVFGRGGEESEALTAAGVPYEIVPGVTAALAAAACLDLPLTHRKHASAVALVTGHELPEKAGNILDWKALAHFPGTLAIYMGVSRLPILVAEMVKWGRDPATPSCLVERAGSGEMRSVSAPLAGLDAARRAAGLEAPGLILIGDAVALRREPSWLEAKPLFGVRVMVTRPRHQARDLVSRLESLGAVPFVLPGIEIRDAADPGPLDAALATLAEGGWNWLVFSSANGVHAFVKRLRARGRDLRDLGGVKLACVGAKTAAVFSEYHLTADVVPAESHSADALADVLMGRVTGQRVLLVGTTRGKATLRERLAAVADVHAVVAYEQVDAVDPACDEMAALRRGEIGVVTFASANTARAVVGAFDEVIRGRVTRGDVKLVCLSRDVASAVESLGLPVAGVADRATVEELMKVVSTVTTMPPSAIVKSGRE
jgi:uroporphyrinogen III methyltransferase/synthase